MFVCCHVGDGVPYQSPTGELTNSANPLDARSDSAKRTAPASQLSVADTLLCTRAESGACDLSSDRAQYVCVCGSQFIGKASTHEGV